MRYHAPPLVLGQVFWCVHELLVCVRVNDCSARVVKTTMAEVNGDRIYDEYDRFGYRITTCPEIAPNERVTILTKDRIKIHESAFKPRRDSVIGTVEIPISSHVAGIGFGKKPKKSVKVDQVSDAISLVELFEVGARILAGLIKAS